MATSVHLIGIRIWHGGRETCAGRRAHEGPLRIGSWLGGGPAAYLSATSSEIEYQELAIMACGLAKSSHCCARCEYGISVGDAALLCTEIYHTMRSHTASY
jgi:hypothetical protein